MEVSQGSGGIHDPLWGELVPGKRVVWGANSFIRGVEGIDPALGLTLDHGDRGFVNSADLESGEMLMEDSKARGRDQGPGR